MGKFKRIENQIKIGAGDGNAEDKIVDGNVDLEDQRVDGKSESVNVKGEHLKTCHSEFVLVPSRFSENKNLKSFSKLDFEGDVEDKIVEGNLNRRDKIGDDDLENKRGNSEDKRNNVECELFKTHHLFLVPSPIFRKLI